MRSNYYLSENFVMRGLFLSVIFIVLSGIKTVQAQSAPLVYRKIIPGNMRVNEVLQLPDGGFLHAGEGNGGYGLLMRTDTLANVAFYKNFNVNSPNVFPNAAFRDMVADSDSTVFITGLVYNPATTYLDGLVMKSTIQGNSLWERRLEVPGQSVQLKSCDLSADSGVYVAGIGTEPVTFQKEFVVARFDANGNLLWSRTLSGGNNNSYCQDLRTTPDGGCILTGLFEDFPPVQPYIVLMKINAGGALQWYHRYAPTGGNVNYLSGSEIDVLNDGYLVYGAAGSQNVLLKTDTSGNILWSKEIAINGSSGPSGLINFNGSRLVTASSGGYLITTGDDFWTGGLARIDSSGNPQWASITQMRLYDALETTGHEWHLTGGGPLFGVNPPPQPEQNMGGVLDTEIGILQTDSNGFLSTACYYSTSASVSTVSYSLFTFQPLITIQGTASPVSLNTLFSTTNAIDTCVSVFGGNAEVTPALTVAVYPNPARSSCTLSTSRSGRYRIAVYNAWGQLLQHTFFQGTETLLDFQRYPAGIYLCALTDGEGRHSTARIQLNP